MALRDDDIPTFTPAPRPAEPRRPRERVPRQRGGEPAARWWQCTARDGARFVLSFGPTAVVTLRELLQVRPELVDAQPIAGPRTRVATDDADD